MSKIVIFPFYGKILWAQNYEIGSCLCMISFCDAVTVVFKHYIRFFYNRLTLSFLSQ